MTAIDPILTPSPITAESTLRIVAVAAILVGIAFGAWEWATHQAPNAPGGAPAAVEIWRGNSGSLPGAR